MTALLSGANKIFDPREFPKEKPIKRYVLDGEVYCDPVPGSQEEALLRFLLLSGYHYEPTVLVRQDVGTVTRDGKPIYAAGKAKRYWRGQVFESAWDVKAINDQDNRSPPKFQRIVAGGDNAIAAGMANLQRLPNEPVAVFQARLRDEADRAMYAGMSDQEIQGYAADNEVDLGDCPDRAAKIEKVREHQKAANARLLAPAAVQQGKKK